MGAQGARITALLDQLAGLGSKRTGMPIDADEWNMLIDTVRGTLEVAAAQDDLTGASLDLRYAPVDHEHLAEVTNEWLDANLRAAVAGGGSSSAAGAIAGAQLGGQVGRLLDEVGRVRLVLEDQQARIDRTVTDDLDRTTAVSDLRVQVAAVNDLRGVVTGLEGRLSTTTTQIQGLEGLRASLTNAAGQTIDVGALQSDVVELSRLRDSLTDSQGNLVRMRDVLAKIDESSVVSPGAGDLDTRFGTLRGELIGQVDQRLTATEARLNAVADDRSAQTRADLTAQVDQALTAARGEFQQFADTRMSAAEQRLDASIASGLESTATGLRAELSGLAGAAVQAGLADVDSRISSAVEQSRAGVLDSLRSELTQVATTVAGDRVDAVTGPLLSQVDDLSTRVAGLDATIDSSVGDAIGARLDQLTADLDSRTSARIDEARTALASSIADQVGRAVSDQVGDLDARIGATVDNRLADIDTRIDQRIAVRTAELPDIIRTEVQTQVADLDLAGQLGALEGRVTTGFRAELAAAETRIESRRSSSLNDLAVQLRNENVAAQAGLETRINAELATTRLQLTNVNDRLGGLGGITVPVRPIG
jgi:vacuolar-type H+-ATPase subunit E/Vma4